jgi:hypothetical protein
MTLNNEHPPYVEAAIQCYELIHRLKVDDVDDVEGIERAIDLAIERRHEEASEYLFRDVLRNGRFSARRSRARRKRLAHRYAAEQPRAITAKRRIPGDFVADGCLHASVEACQLGEELARLASNCGASGPNILEALIAGQPTSEAAASAGVSRSTAQRTVTKLRSRARELGYAAAA